MGGGSSRTPPLWRGGATSCTAGPCSPTPPLARWSTSGVTGMAWGHRLLAGYSGHRRRLWHPGRRPWRSGTTECGHACRVPSDGCCCRGSGPHRRPGAGRDGGGSLERRGAALSRSRGSGPMTEGVVRWTSDRYAIALLRKPPGRPSEAGFRSQPVGLQNSDTSHAAMRLYS